MIGQNKILNSKRVKPKLIYKILLQRINHNFYLFNI